MNYGIRLMRQLINLAIILAILLESRFGIPMTTCMTLNVCLEEMTQELIPLRVYVGH